MLKLVLNVKYLLLSFLPAAQVLGYQLTLFGPRGADYACHITTGPLIFLEYAASLKFMYV